MSLAVLEIPRKKYSTFGANEWPSSFEFRVRPSSWASSGSPVYNIQFRCLCKECISRSFRIEVLPVRLRLLPFRTTIFNLRNNLFYDDFNWSWRQTAIWSLNYWIVIPTFVFHGNIKQMQISYFFVNFFQIFKPELQWMCHWIRIVSQLMFKCC